MLKKRGKVESSQGTSGEIRGLEDQFTVLKLRSILCPNPIAPVVRTVSKRELERASEIGGREVEVVDVVYGSIVRSGIVNLRAALAVNPGSKGALAASHLDRRRVEWQRVPLGIAIESVPKTDSPVTHGSGRISRDAEGSDEANL